MRASTPSGCSRSMPAVEELGLPLFLHPTDAVFVDMLDGYDGALHLSLGRVVEVSVAAMRLVLSGTDGAPPQAQDRDVAHRRRAALPVRPHGQEHAEGQAAEAGEHLPQAHVHRYGVAALGRHEVRDRVLRHRQRDVRHRLSVLGSGDRAQAASTSSSCRRPTSKSCSTTTRGASWGCATRRRHGRTSARPFRPEPARVSKTDKPDYPCHHRPRRWRCNSAPSCRCGSKGQPRTNLIREDRAKGERHDGEGIWPARLSKRRRRRRGRRRDRNASHPAAGGAGAAASPRRTGRQGYAFLNLEEAAFVEALVDHMVPADELTPEGHRHRHQHLHRPRARGRLGQRRPALHAGPVEEGRAEPGLPAAADARAALSRRHRGDQRALPQDLRQDLRPAHRAQRQEVLVALSTGKINSTAGCRRASSGPWSIRP